MFFLFCGILLTAFARTPTTTVLTVSANPVAFAQPVTLTATVSAGDSVGQVTFYDGVTILGTRPVTGGKATFTVASLPSGQRDLTATYSGDGSYAPSKSNHIAEAITTLPQNGFQPLQYLEDVGGGNYSLVSADFEGNGKMDLAALFQGGFQVFLVDASGKFPQVGLGYFLPGSGGQSLALGDLNGDGFPDLVAYSYYGSVSVYLGRGDGTFQRAVSYAVASGNGTVVVADFNGDGKADIAVSADYSGTSSVDVLLGNGDGTLQNAIHSTVSGGSKQILAGDFNRDGLVDLAIVYHADSVGIVLGNGDGTFGKEAFYSIESDGMETYGTATAVAADFNGDGITDLAVVEANRWNIGILIGNGDGSFRSPVNYGVGNYPQGLAVGDFNGDGRQDLVVSNSRDHNIGLLTGSGDGTFQAVATYTVNEAGPGSLLAGNFTGSGFTDLLIENGNQNILLLPGAGIPDLRLDLTHASPGGMARVPITLGVVGEGMMIDAVTFTLTIQPSQNMPPPLAGLSFSNDPSRPYGQVQTATSDSITVKFSAPAAFSGAQFHIGDVEFSVPATASAPPESAPQQAYGVALSGVTASLAGHPAAISVGATSQVNIRRPYSVGDVVPSAVDTLGDFGDGTLDTLDLLEMLRAITNVPGHVPQKCSDMFDAMDLYPVDTASQRGGDGAIDILDLLTMLRRVTNADPSRPMRTSPPPCPSTTVPTTTRLHTSEPDAVLDLAPEGQRVAIYLRASKSLSIAGPAFSLEAGKAQIHFVPADGLGPSLIDTAIPSRLALAWLNGIEAKAGARLLLGYVESSEDALRFVGVSANANRDGRPLRIAFGRSR